MKAGLLSISESINMKASLKKKNMTSTRTSCQ